MIEEIFGSVLKKKKSGKKWPLYYEVEEGIDTLFLKKMISINT